jgi:hypothetical protein
MSNFALLLVLFFVQCSSFFKEPGRPPKINNVPIEDKYRKLYVQNIRNNSYGVNIHNKLTRILRVEIDRRGRFIQTRIRESAAYKLYGEVVHFQEIGNLLDPANQPISSEIFIVVKIDIIDTEGKKLLLERNQIPIRGYYSNQIGYKESLEMATERLLRNLAIRIAEETENAWYYEMLRIHEVEQLKLNETFTE